MRRLFLKSIAAAVFALSAGFVSAQESDHDPENILNLEITGVTNGIVQILLRPDIAPQHVERIKELTRSGAYDGLAFHRVIDEFMAQTGDVKFGKAETYDPRQAGRGGSDLDNVPAEISDLAFDEGVVGMARSNELDSANSQFFIMFQRVESLDGNYTVFGRVIEGMDVVHGLKRGNAAANGAIAWNPDVITRAWISADEG